MQTKTLITVLKHRIKLIENSIREHYKDCGHCDYHDTTDYGMQEFLSGEKSATDSILQLVRDLDKQ